ncbi:substrate-binding domain-containing protein [Paenibacillus sp. WQ 127069]|uniref:Substrate-binding domain-containing protein n=2 Tax=Paenibacillus baimaensis TaxID=2982185 RepID=A0ABT2UG28_9BACL|nr:substrate-binding domain-containing protein [Paenibacillus sp. WQ 127069]
MGLPLKASWGKARRPIFGCRYWSEGWVDNLKMKLGSIRWLPLLLAGIVICTVLVLIKVNMARPGGNQPHILVMMKAIDPKIEFWNTVGAGIEAARKEFDVQVEVQGPDNEFDVEGQIYKLKEALKSKPDAVVLVASDYEALVPWAEKIRKQGIPLIMMDSGINSTAANSFIATDNIAAGRKMGEVLSKLVDPSKQIAIVSHVQGTSTAIQREQGARSGLSEALQKSVVGTYFSNGSEDRAYEITKELLIARDDIGGIAGLNEITTVGAARAIKELGLKEQVKLVGFDSSTNEIKWIEEGVIQAVVIQKPFNMGYLGVKTAYEALQGKKVAPIIDTGSEVINKQNIYTIENQKLLFPFSSP